jgi:hypothetical protein
MVRALTSRSRGKRAVVAVLLAFALVAGAVAYVIVAAPAAAVVRARRWRVAECTVISSGVKRLARDAYELDLAYEWPVGGRAFRGSRLDFFRRARQDPGEWAPLLRRLRPGQVVTCYVDPARPEEATIDRGWNGGVAVPAAVLAIFLATVLALGYVPEAATSALGPGPRLTAPGPVPLRPRTTPRRRLVRALGLAVSLNAVAGLLFAARLLPEWREGRPSWLLTLVVGAFALGGVAQIGRAARALAGLAGPTVLVTAVPEARLGERLIVEWKVEQRAHLVTGLELALVGREIARYPDWDANGRQEQREERAEFFRAPLALDRAGDSSWAGRAGIDLPWRLPPSLDARSNQIAWTIALHVGVRGRPDLADEYPVLLRPPGKAAA